MNRDQDTHVNELDSEKQPAPLLPEVICEESEIPLFLRDTSEGQKCDAQDEKDKTEE